MHRRAAGRRREHETDRVPTLKAMPAIRPITLVDQVVNAFIRAAAEGRFLPGDRVVEAEIAREFRVSRVPVREALRLLESQGILVNEPYRGMRLMEVDGRHLHEILAVRASLERLAARGALAAYRRDVRVIGGLEEAVRQMRRAVEDGSGFELAKADTAFHRALCQIVGNAVLLQVWETLARRLTIIVGLSTLTKNLDSIYQEHVELLDVFRRGGLRALDRAVADHIVRQTEMVDFASVISARREGSGGRVRHTG